MEEVVDCTNNAANVTGFRDGEYIVLEFTRPLIASDTCDRPVSNTLYVLVAWGNGHVPNTIQEHLSRFICSPGVIDWFAELPPTSSTVGMSDS